MGLISNDYYIKIFNKEHIILEEVYEISELTYTKTLNGIWKASLTLPRSIKTTEDIEKTCGVTVLASIPFDNSDNKKGGRK